ncbi:MAG: RidA family protein [Acidimicrobiia bacterium]|nr:RidA family protein [Acidimicrobiia bacterium]
MGVIDDRISELGLVLPPPITVPAGVVLPSAFVRVHGDRAYVSGHGPQGPDGSLEGPFGLVGRDVSEEEAVSAARRTALSALGSLQRALGSLDRITGWLRVFGMVAAVPGFERQPVVINGFSDLIIDIFGAERGAHARSAIGVASLPFAMPVEVEATVTIAP